MARSAADSLDTFDSQFGGTQSVFNWVQDLESEPGEIPDIRTTRV
jgi:hypothetical protein